MAFWWTRVTGNSLNISTFRVSIVLSLKFPSGPRILCVFVSSMLLLSNSHPKDKRLHSCSKGFSPWLLALFFCFWTWDHAGHNNHGKGRRLEGRERRRQKIGGREMGVFLRELLHSTRSYALSVHYFSIVHQFMNILHWWSQSHHDSINF